MIRTFINSFKVSFTESANTFIYFLKRFPLIGKKISDNLYKETEAKIIIGFVSEAFGIIGAVLRKALYIAVMLGLPAYAMSRGANLFFTKFLHMFFFLNIIFGSIMNVTIFNETDKSAYDMITLMRADAREYYISAMLYKYITNFIYFVLPMMIAGLIIGFSTLKAIVLLILLTSCKFIGESINLFIYTKTKKIIGKSTVFVIIFAIIMLALAYVLPLLDIYLNLTNVFFNVFVVFGILALGTLALIYLWKYKGYTVIAKELLTKDKMFDMKNFQGDITFGDVKINEEKISKEELRSKVYENKKGYEYLNAIFYKRNRKVLVNPIKFRVILIAAAFLASSTLAIFIPASRKEIYNAVLESTPMLVFLMYLMSTGERICKAMFFNCDLSLLRYGYYREGKAILANFTIRLKKAVYLNIIPALALCIAIAGVLIIAGFGMKVISVVPVFLCILCLAGFFSIHNLFMYYVLQPYTAELTVKSPLYKFVNFAVYIVSYVCLKVRTSSYIFILVVLAVTVIYMAAALILTYKVAPKTFKLK